MARSAEDCALLLSAMSGFDARDATSAQRPPQDFHAQMLAPRDGASAARPLAGLRIGLPKEFFPAGLAGDVDAAVRRALAELESLGATLVDVSLPRTELSIPVYYIIAPAEASSNLSRFDGVKFGHRAAQYADLLDMYKKSRAEGFGPEVKRRIMIGTYVLSHGYYDAYYLQALKLRRMIADDFQACFSQCDLIAGPVAPSVAWNGAAAGSPGRGRFTGAYSITLLVKASRRVNSGSATWLARTPCEARKLWRRPSVWPTSCIVTSFR
jgi:aspartyl-tRNA(Asn)/glutamyl-tRNA(Gln) amidotransferase subunit A